MDSNKKFIIIIVAVVAVGLAVIMGVRSFTGAGRVDTAEGQAAIKQATSGRADPGVVQQIRPEDRQAPQGIGRLPGNKGNR
jgi:flagellar basal body-associated protein FliL